MSATISTSTTVSAPEILASGATLTVASGVTLTSTGSSAVYAGTAAGLVTLTNQGDIVATTTLGDSGVLFRDGGAVSDALGASITGYAFGVEIEGAAGSVSNAGTIAGETGGVALRAGGTITNSGAIVVATAITSQGKVVELGAGGSLVNTGLISASGSHMIAVYLDAGGMITNSGTITAAGTTDGVVLGSGTLENDGSIASGVQLTSGILDNAPGATISGDVAVNVRGAGSVANEGTILGVGGAFATGVNLAAGATLSNAGTISAGNYDGVELHGASISNAAGGVISGAIGVYASAPAFSGQPAGTIVNAGTIASTAGIAGTALVFSGGDGALIIDPGADFIGKVSASAAPSSVIALASASSAGTISALGAQFIGFPTISEDQGASWTIGGPVMGHETFTLGSDATLNFANIVESGSTVDFSPGNLLEIGVPGGFAGVLDSFVPGDTLDLTSLSYVSGDSAALTTASGGQSMLDLIAGNGTTLATLAFDASASDPHPTFTVAPLGGGTAITEGVPCFARGTRIRTKRGEIAVEALAVGDEVVVLGGGARPVRWVGRRRIDISRHPRPETVCPVHILPDAIAPGVPGRGVWVSPGHALYIEGALIPAEFLINGATILRQRVERVEYFHVELDQHAVLFSENLPSESYLDTGNRAAFENAGALALHPDFSPRHWSATCVPLVLGGERLFAARRRLLGRVAELGYGASEDADLHVRVAGRRIDPVRRAGGWHCFLLPAGAREARILSRPGVPAGRDPETMDCRTLGAQIAAIFLNETLVPLDSPCLRAGFYPLEQEGADAWRWSDGEGRLALPACAEPTALRLRIANMFTGWRRPDGSFFNPSDTVDGMPAIDHQRGPGHVRPGL